MANFHKFKCTFNGTGRYGVGGNSYVNGDIFVLTEDNVKRFVRTNDIINGNIEYMGEVDGNDTYISSNMTTYLNGKSGLSKNTLPVSVVPLCTAKATTVQGEDIAAGAAIVKRVAIDRFLVRMPALQTSAAGINTPRLLTTAGTFEPLTPSTLTYYDSSTATYGAITNGSIAAAAPITWAANDLMIVGYTEKFASVNPTFTTAASAGLISDVSYWNGSSWTSFDSFTDYTKEPGATNSFDRAGLETNTRVTWWEKPEDWHPGGPAGAGISESVYCVALKVNGALTDLAGGALWVLTDTPLCDINTLGPRVTSFDAVVTSINAVLADETTDAASSAAGDVDIATLGNVGTDAIYFGASNKFGGIDVDMSAAVNNNASTINLYYWTGARWSAVATVATAGWGGTVANGPINAGASFAQDGRITWLTSPSDWSPEVATNVTGLSTSTPATVTTTPLYWIKLTVSAAQAAATAVTQMWALPPTGAVIEVNATPQSYVGPGDPIHVYVVDEDASATLTISAVVADI